MKKWIALNVLSALLGIAVSNGYAAIPENIWELPFDQQLKALVTDLSEEPSEEWRSSVDWIAFALKDHEHQQAEILAGLYVLLDLYNNADSAKTYATLALIDEYPNELSVDPLIAAWKKNAAIEEEVAYKISKIFDVTNSEKAYAAMVKMYKEGAQSNFLFSNLVTEATADRVPALVGFFNDPSFDGHREILRKLAEIATSGLVVPLAIQTLNNDEIAMRQTASTILGDLNDKSAVAALKQAQKVEKDIFVKLNMSEQLVRLGEFLYLDEILKVVESSKWGDLTDVRNVAFEQLKDLTGQNFEDSIVAWRKWYEQEKVKRGLK